jgi:Dienelactone hydrolase family
MRNILVVLLSLSLIIASLVLPMSMANSRAIPFAYAQTNAAMLTTIADTYSNVASNAAVSYATANTSTSAAAAAAAAAANATTTAGLQIKRDVNYFDSSSGYLVYHSSDTSGMKLPAVVMVHEWWGINDNIKGMADNLAKQGYVVLAVDLFNTFR